jgi:hypothetical protein
MRGDGLMARKKIRDLRLEASNLLVAIMEHDPFLDHVGREALDIANIVLDNARNAEIRAVKLAEDLREEDVARALRLGTNPEEIPPVDDYIMTRGTA